MVRGDNSASYQNKSALRSTIPALVLSKDEITGITDLQSHPSQPLFALTAFDGSLQLVKYPETEDMETHEIVKNLIQPTNHTVSCRSMKFDAHGNRNIEV